MTSKLNRFAALSPDFEAEQEQQRKKEEELKAKKEATVKGKAEEKTQARPYTQRAPQGEAEGRYSPSERGRGRGRGRGTRPYRGRGRYRGYEGGPQEWHGESGEPKEKHAAREFKPHGYQGTGDPMRPYERRSGTGRGTEIAKGGAGPYNWGDPRQEMRYAEGAEAIVKQEEGKETPRAEGEAVSPAEHAHPEEKKAEVKEEKVLTYSEYQAKLAEKQVPTKKAEVALAKDPKAAPGLVPYEKKQEKAEAVIKGGKKKEAYEEAPAKGEREVLGTFIGEEPRGRGRGRGGRRGGRWRGGEGRPEAKAEAPAEPGKTEEGAEAHRGRGGYRGGRGGHFKAEEHKAPEKPTAAPFVMNENDFPSF